MTITKLRIILEVEEDVFRDIEIRDDQTLLELHEGIKQAFEMEGEEMASFYLSNDDWFQGSEIPLMDISEEEAAETMADITVGQVIPQKGNKMIFVYDFLSLWTFYVEVVETEVISVNSEFPAVVFSYGQRPEEAPEKDLLGELDIDSELDFDDEDEDDDPYGFGGDYSSNGYW